MRKFFTPIPNPRSLLAMLPLLAFDLDGTLVDSAPDIVSAVNIVLTRHHKPALPYETIVAHIGDGLRQLITDAFAPYHPSERSQRDIELEFYSTYEQEMLKLTKPFPGVMEFLASYKGPIGVITNKSERPARIILDHLGFDAFPWVQIYGGDTCEEKKPSALPLEKMMALAQRSPQNTLMIGDGTPDMGTAQNSGATAVAITFGYSALAILEKYQPRFFLHHYRELPKIIEEFSKSK